MNAASRNFRSICEIIRASHADAGGRTLTPSRNGTCRDWTSPVSVPNRDAASRVSTWIPSRLRSTWYQQQLSRRLPAFQVAVGLRRLCERINMLDPQFKLACADHFEDGGGAPLQFFAS